jgi:hypothetical protein
MSELARTFSIILLFAMIMGFIITMTRMLLDYRVKKKMIEKGIPDSMALQ